MSSAGGVPTGEPDWAGFQAQKLEAQKKAQLAVERQGLVPLHCLTCSRTAPPCAPPYAPLCPTVCCCE